MDNNNKLITILGPTASGKTRLAALLADKTNSEIISADSRQVYKCMDIGTGKDYHDYIIEDNISIPYHLIDIVEAGTKYNVYEYQKDFLGAYNDIVSRGKNVILCGGTGMYIEAVTKGYKLIQVPVDENLRHCLEEKSDIELIEILSGLKQLHNTSDTDTRKRIVRAIEIAAYYKNNPKLDLQFPNFDTVYLGVRYQRNKTRDNITKRLNERLSSGLIDEVKGLLDSGIKPEDLIFYGLEYKYLTLYLTKEISYNEMFSKLNTAIHQFAKRQMTWFRKMERQGIKINWIEGDQPIGTKLSIALSLTEG